MIYRKTTKSDIHILVELRKKLLIDEGLDPSTNIDFELNRFFQTRMADESLIQYVAVEVILL
ncbi:hypothetical protein R0131_16380 [Clostridium sp. AL.422]|uniref:hypothetical protein n=1 Tax=Clostridium TaxID=1485 RepID=UPI00293DE559|nr:MULTISPECIES: hypothetical protein [unclassified Clostridium]MDV4152404.1 hypothetical protein [Clostridium sp. AL.422]